MMLLPTHITLKSGDSGIHVCALQECLSYLRYLKPSDVNGQYDAVTFAAVRAYQRDKGLAADGVAGPVTLKSLNGEEIYDDEDAMLAPEANGVENTAQLTRGPSLDAEVKDESLAQADPLQTLAQSVPADRQRFAEQQSGLGQEEAIARAKLEADLKQLQLRQLTREGDRNRATEEAPELQKQAEKAKGSDAYKVIAEFSDANSAFSNLMKEKPKDAAPEGVLRDAAEAAKRSGVTFDGNADKIVPQSTPDQPAKDVGRML